MPLACSLPCTHPTHTHACAGPGTPSAPVPLGGQAGASQPITMGGSYAGSLKSTQNISVVSGSLLSRSLIRHR